MQGVSKDVFAITLKVLLSLLLISLAIGIGFLVAGGISVAPASCRQQSRRDAGATLLPVFQPAWNSLGQLAHGTRA